MKQQRIFHFHAIEENNAVKDFPIGILDAARLIIYAGGRSKPLQLTGLYADIETIELKHKSKIKGKENAETEFYYEIQLKELFTESEELKFIINPKKIFDKTDSKNIKLLKQYLPSLTTWERIIKSNL